MTSALIEKLKRSRKAARAAFTRALTAFNEEIRREEPIIEEVQVTFQILEARSFEIIEDEYEVAAKYTSKYLCAKIEVTKLNRASQPEQTPQIYQQITAGDNADSKRRFKLPKIELKKFGRDLKDFLQFWSQFKNIHEDKSITTEDMFQYLIQAMIPNSRAADLVNSFPPSQNYDKVINSLKNRFGKDELLVEVYVKELLTLVISKATKSREQIPFSKMYDKLEAQLRALEFLCVTKDKCAAMLYALVESSLPEELIRTWQRQATAIKSDKFEERLTKLTEFLQSEVENERLRMAVNRFNLNDNKPSCNNNNKLGKKKIRSIDEISIPTATGLLTRESKNVNQSTKNYLCIFCKEHRSSRCGKAKQMPLEEKWSIVKERNCCFNCLIPGHNTQACKFNSKCQWCGKKHSILLCREILNKDKSLRETTSEDLIKHNKEANLGNASLIPEVCLQTIRVILKNDNKKRVVRAIMDSGSQRSYISKQAAEEMEYQLHCENRVVHLLFGGTSTKPQNHRGYLIHLKSLDNEYACNFTAFNQDMICHGIPSINNGPWIHEFVKRNIILTDVGQSTDPIEVLIGADVIGKLMTVKLHNLECEMTAVETKLGWTLMGKKPTEENSKHDAALIVTSMFVQEADISNLWSLDVMGITDPVETKSSKKELKKRFVGDFGKQQELYEEYDQVFMKLLKEGIIEKVTVEEENLWGHYLPHRHVLKENSTTRLRPVFDASAKSKNGVFLNQCLETDPNLIELIPSILLRFREKEIAVISDIEIAFLQISITPRDRNVLRFLWWNENNIIEIYRYTRVVFGVTSSPFILAAIIKLHLERIAQEDQFIHIHKIFDPIGFACPMLLYPKILLQTINTLEWDTEVPQEVEQEFRKWYYQLHLLKEVKIPRWISNSYRVDNKILFHVFVDASQVAYASVIYMRTQSLTDTKIQLIAAKSRVTPNKKMTIPRLELLAATIGARLMKSILETMENNQQEVYFWSDSTTVLTWIQRKGNGQRLYVPGVLNPADPSRGCTTKQLIESNWWEGPDWLYNSEKWPTSEYYINNEEINSELKKSASKKSEESINLNNFCQNNDVREDNSFNKNNDEWHLRYFSRYTKLVRMFGWIRRFIHNDQVNVKLRKRGELSVREFCEAKKTVLRFVQEESFSGDQGLRIKDFRAYTDRDNLIRIKTLITQRDDDINFRETVVLNPKHPVVMKKFWILQGRKSVRMIVNKCITCKRYKASHVNAEPVALPKNRVGNAVPFEISGVDFAGPVYLKENQKGWICLFTCAVYRAVHLELVTSLSTDAFLEVLRHVIARRGRSTIIYSDNGTNFTGAKNYLCKINWNKIKRYSSVQKIEWCFNPPSAAWWGGWWERLVHVMKELLRKVLKKSSLTYEEVCTTLCDFEAIINSRPITYQSDSINEPRPLSPAMFLLEAKSVEVPDLDCVETIDLKKSQRIGEIVLVGNDNQKRLDWPLAKIVKTITGKDGEIRVVRLKTGNGKLVGPVQRIYQLEINSLIEQEITKETEITLSKENENEECQLVKKPSVVTRYGRQVKIPKRLGLND
ncbi:hypothetical protein ILUMI_19347 [Ignelater luminosus]|uniref:Integrase catalytic domain-containing protein n=1 Tax=Ignelater luminosus TaxID=2038154 RepID=A0A8K0CKQ0_IGNLU|nr:hypothetical protein ILUMI_19347 [Ignelater luminosus]